MDRVSSRQADLYVFARRAHEEIEALNPMDVRQRRFFVFATSMESRTFSLRGSGHFDEEFAPVIAELSSV